MTLLGSFVWWVSLSVPLVFAAVVVLVVDVAVAVVARVVGCC
jgi:hypothetical protein